MRMKSGVVSVFVSEGSAWNGARGNVRRSCDSRYADVYGCVSMRLDAQLKMHNTFTLAMHNALAVACRRLEHAAKPRALPAPQGKRTFCALCVSVVVSAVDIMHA